MLTKILFKNLGIGGNLPTVCYRVKHWAFIFIYIVLRRAVIGKIENRKRDFYFPFSEAMLGVFGIRDNWANYLRDKG